MPLELYRCKSGHVVTYLVKKTGLKPGRDGGPPKRCEYEGGDARLDERVLHGQTVFGHTDSKTSDSGSNTDSDWGPLPEYALQGSSVFRKVSSDVYGFLPFGNVLRPVIQLASYVRRKRDIRAYRFFYPLDTKAYKRSHQRRLILLCNIDESIIQFKSYIR